MNAQIEQLISEFKLNEARQALLSIPVNSISIADRSYYANLSRRCGLFKLALQFSHELVYGTKFATPKDLLEYANGLRRIGLINESLRILDRLPPTAKTTLQRALCHMQRWDFGTAAGHLLLSLETSSAEHEIVTAKVNLALCLAFLNELDAAEKWLAGLAANPTIWEIQAQIESRRGNWPTVLKMTEEHAEGVSAFLLRKWKHVMALAQNKNSESLGALHEFKQQIRSAGQWESLRHLDWEIALATDDKELAARVYFGSPHLAFRQQILASRFGPKMPDYILRTDSRWNGQHPKIINGLTGQNMPFSYDSLPFRASLLMLSDCYQPWTIYRLFDGLFPEENFDPFKSVKRLQGIVSKISTEVRKRKTPLEIRQSAQGYRLRPCDEGAIIIFDEMRFLSVEAMVLSLLKVRFKDQAFKLKDIDGLTPLNRKQNALAIQSLLDDQALEVVNGRLPKYRVKAS